MAEVAVGKVADVGEAAYQRSLAVMRRQWATYDHEKVFWNSTWTVGLIGLGWIAIQLGKAIENVQGIPTSFAQALGIGSIPFTDDRFQYASIVYYVEGPGKNVDVPDIYKGAALPLVGLTIIPNVYDRIYIFREDSTAYTTFKLDWEQDHPEHVNWVKDIKAKMSPLSFSPSVILHQIDKFFGEYGPVLPLAAVLGHMGLESLRVYRIRKRLK